MSQELTLLGWTLVLALAQILLPALMRTLETGAEYNASPRDEASAAPVGKITGRLQRAQQNLFETLPLYAAAVLIAHVAGREGMLTLWGSWLYLVARIVYVPLYGAGIPVIRSLAWSAGLVGIVLILIAILVS